MRPCTQLGVRLCSLGHWLGSWGGPGRVGSGLKLRPGLWFLVNAHVSSIGDWLVLPVLD